MVEEEEEEEAREQMRSLPPDNQAPEAGKVADQWFQLSLISSNLSAEIATALLLPQSATSLLHFMFLWGHEVRTIRQMQYGM